MPFWTRCRRVPAQKVERTCPPKPAADTGAKADERQGARREEFPPRESAPGREEGERRPGRRALAVMASRALGRGDARGALRRVPRDEPGAAGVGTAGPPDRG